MSVLEMLLVFSFSFAWRDICLFVVDILFARDSGAAICVYSLLMHFYFYSLLNKGVCT